MEVITQQTRGKTAIALMQDKENQNPANSGFTVLKALRACSDPWNWGLSEAVLDWLLDYRLPRLTSPYYMDSNHTKNLLC